MYNRDNGPYQVKNGYIEPTTLRIDRGERTERLYSLEEKLHEAVRACATEWGKVVGSKSFWEVQLGQTLFDLLSSYEQSAAVLAAVAFLKSEGYSIEAVRRPSEKESA